MMPSNQNPSWIVSASNAFLILMLHISHTTGVGGANLTVVNQCSEIIWAVVGNASATQGKEVRVNSSLTFRQPDGWGGRVWSKTGCIFNESGSGSCATGDTAAVTVAEFKLGQMGSINIDSYHVSLVDGFNLPLVVQPIGGSGRCGPTGCTQDLNKRCPFELRAANGSACRGPCTVFGTAEYCCNGTAPCGPTPYSRLFKDVCPSAYSYPHDDATGAFACGSGADYTIIFCPPPDFSLAMPPAASPYTPSPAPTPATATAKNYPQEREGTPSPAPTPATATAKNNPQEREGNNDAKGIISKVTLLLFICSNIMATFILVKKRCCRKSPARDRDMENLLLQHGSLAPKRYRYSDIKKITKSLNDKLGQGGYGSVYKGVLPDGRLAAVKILTETDSNGEEFINEVVSISRTSHVNIVKLLGFCYEDAKRALVYEFMPNKSLDMFLDGIGDRFLDLKTRYEIAVGVARGLEYLHTGCTTRIVHFDIKPQNILLDEEMCPKISDFGLAKLCKKKQSILSVLGTRGTIGYIAPEVFSRNFGGVSHKSDVYSYGMMLLEMAGAKDIVGNGAIQSSENYFPDKIYEQVIMHEVVNNVDELGIEEEEEAKKKMFMVGFWCIQTIPSERPSISKVVEMLEGSVESIQIPPKPVLFHRPLNTDLDHSSSFSTHVKLENLAQD